MIIWGRSVEFIVSYWYTNSLIYRNLFGLFGRGSGRGSVYWRGYEYLRYDGPMSPCASRWYYHGLAMGKSSGISVLSISKMFSVWFGSSLPHKNQNTLQRFMLDELWLNEINHQAKHFKIIFFLLTEYPGQCWT